ncbi:MAG TPA: GntR family transcriptional regulator [Verrucomicrobiae bacterium]|nr:GntR family transcriptional regulator [Verrucomicrobiae bacterium]
MIFHITARSGIPPYLQIVQQVKQDVRLGLLREGDKLPTVREVVTMITVNPNTVVKAYRELESQGFVEKRSGIGTFVSKQTSTPSPDVQADLLHKLDVWITGAAGAGLDEESIEALFNTALHKRKGHHHGTESKS